VVATAGSHGRRIRTPALTTGPSKWATRPPFSEQGPLVGMEADLHCDPLGSGMPIDEIS
jgi:hypothetical protein